MPFSSNTFIIRDLARLARFAQRLSPVQQRAVNRLEFVSTEPERPPATISAFRFEDYTGLRHLRIRMEIMKSTHEDALENWAGWYWSEMLSQFAQKTLASAEVMVYRTSGSAVMPVTREWAKQVEGKLLEVKEEPEEAEAEVEGELRADEKTESTPDEKPSPKRKREDESKAEQQQKRATTRARRGLRDLQL